MNELLTQINLEIKHIDAELRKLNSGKPSKTEYTSFNAGSANQESHLFKD
jgi:hypothetical protein